MRFFALAAATVLILQGIALSVGDPPAPSSQDDPAIRFMLANTMWTLVHEMVRSGARYGLQSMCEGGGLANR